MGVIGGTDSGINSSDANIGSDVAGVHVGSCGSDVSNVHNSEKEEARDNGIVPPFIDPTHLVIPDVTCNSGDKINFTMSVYVDNYGYCPTGTVTFYGENGYSKVVTLTPGTMSMASFFDIPVSDEAGVHSYKIEYSGDIYTPSEFDFINVTVKPLDVNLSVPNVTVTSGDKLSFDASIVDVKGNAVNEGNVTFYGDDGHNVVANVSNGVAVFKDVSLTDKSGVYSYNLSYSGDSKHNPKNSTIKVTVEPRGVIFDNNTVTFKYGDRIDFHVAVMEYDHTPITGGNVTFYGDDGNTVVAKIWGGIAVFDDVTVSKDAGNHSYELRYSGDSKHKSSTATLKIKIEPLSVNLSAPSISSKFGDKVNFNVSVVDENGNAVNGGNVTFYGDNGNAVVDVIDGVAKFVNVKLSSCAGVYSYDIKYSGDRGHKSATSKINATIESLNVVLSDAEVKVNYGDKLNFSVSVVDEESHLVNGGNVTLFMDDNNVTVNVVNGIATFNNVSVPSKDALYLFGLKYSGVANKYNSDNATLFLNVIGMNVTINVPDVHSVVGQDNISFNASVVDKDGNPINGGNLTIMVDDGDSHSASVKNGVAVFKNIAIPSKAGNYSYKIFYSCDEKYGYSSTLINIIVSKLDAKFTNPTTGSVYNGEGYNVTLKDANDNVLVDKNVVITILGKNYNVTTDANGVAKVKVKVASKYVGKSLKVNYNFAGDETYNSISGSSNIDVVKMASKITNASAKVVKNHKNFYVKLTTDSGKALANKVITI